MQPYIKYKSEGYNIFFIKIALVVSLLFSTITSCRKLVQIPPPPNSITTSQVFTSDVQALSAAAGMYLRMINGSPIFSSDGMTFFGGVSADELSSFDQSSFSVYVPFQNNKLLSTNASVGNVFWNPAYSDIYSANSIIAGLDNNDNVHDSLKNELVGEAKFIRAFCNFYLVNLFGDIPLVTTTNWHNTALISRMPVSQVYQAIVSDLKDAQSALAIDYSSASGQRIIPNKWAATALLARVYLYTSDWANAETQATALIDNQNLFALEGNLNNVFSTTSREAIWQLQQDKTTIFLNSTPEGFVLNPRVLNSNIAPPFYLTDKLLSSFEPNDQRKIDWVNSTLYTVNNTKYYYPYKYKMGPGQASLGAYSEFYMVLRLAEQYLIRAEARAKLNHLQDALDDLNMVRHRAQLSDTAANNQADLLSLIAHERQIEFFSEWGHRWLDLKRTNQATTVLGPIKPNWNSNAELFPIPVGELATDPNLTQNSGYQ